MTYASHTRRGFLLVELMAVLAIGALLLGILGKMVVDMIYLQRVATQHADRVAVMQRAHAANSHRHAGRRKL